MRVHGKPVPARLFITHWAPTLAVATGVGLTAGLHSGWAAGLATALAAIGTSVQHPRPEQPEESTAVKGSEPPDTHVIVIHTLVMIYVEGSGPALPEPEQDRP